MSVNPFTSGPKFIILVKMLSHIPFCFWHAILCSKHTNPWKIIIDRSFRCCPPRAVFLKLVLWRQHRIAWLDLWRHAKVRHWHHISSGNGLQPVWRQTITWTNADVLSIGPLGTNFSEIRIKIKNFSFMKMHLKTSTAKWRPFCPEGNEYILMSWCKIGASPLRTHCRYHSFAPSNQFKSLWP